MGIFSFSIKPRDIVIAALCGAIHAILQIISTFFTPIPGLSVFYPPSGFGAAIGIWFGFWGWLGAVLGTLFSAPYWGYSIPVALMFGILTPWEVLIPAILWRIARLDPELKEKRSLLIFILAVAVVGTFLDALFGMIISIGIGWYTPEFAFTIAIWPWWLADLVAAMVLGIILLRALSSYVKKIGLFYEGLFMRRISK
jgi:hypothetical protein